MRTGTGTTSTIFVIVVTIGDGRSRPTGPLAGAERCSVRAVGVCADATAPKAADSVATIGALCEAAPLPATRLWPRPRARATRDLWPFVVCVDNPPVRVGATLGAVSVLVAWLVTGGLAACGAVAGGLADAVAVVRAVGFAVGVAVASAVEPCRSDVVVLGVPAAPASTVELESVEL